MGNRSHKVIKGNCSECQFEPENGHAPDCSQDELENLKCSKCKGKGTWMGDVCGICGGLGEI